MRRIAIVGGIGSGKTTVTTHLRNLGHCVVDADEVARDVVAPGRPAWRALRDAFGDAVLDVSGAIDRAFLARVAFTDPSALARLNAITHPAIGVEMARQLDECRGEWAFVAIPLFRPEHRSALRLDEVWGIFVSPEVALERLVGLRGMDPTDARARIQAQESNEARRALVDREIWNDGTPEEMLARVDALLAGVVTP